MVDQQIDPRDFGALEAEVHFLSNQVNNLTTKVDALLELANKSKGGFWVGMTVASALGAIASIGLERAIK